MGRLALTSETLTTPETGTLEYDGGELYFTPLGTQRGLIPNMQYYRLNSALVGANSNAVQNFLGVGVTLSSSTVYRFEGYFAMSKTAGTTAHSISTLFGGTATINNIGYNVIDAGSSSSSFTTGIAPTFYYVQTASATAVTGVGLTVNNVINHIKITGTVSVNVGGTFIPQYQLSAAPGGAYTVAAGSDFLIYPVGASGSNTSIGTWA